MKSQHKSTSKFIKFLNGKGFYVVLCLCFLGLGIAVWSGVEGIKNSVDNGNASSSNQTSEAKPPQDTVLKPPSQSGNTSSKQPSSSQQKPSSESNSTEEASTGVAAFFVKPMLGEVMKSFSDSELQYSETFLDMRLHKGVDIIGKQGDPVCAAGEGVVKEIKDDPLLGTVITIDHGNKIIAKYCGLAKNPPVKKGDTVDSSVRIGVLGDIPSESVEPYHLHLEFYKDGKAVNPLDFIQ